jgi:hypothetical protein
MTNRITFRLHFDKLNFFEGILEIEMLRSIQKRLSVLRLLWLDPYYRQFYLTPLALALAVTRLQ